MCYDQLGHTITIASAQKPTLRLLSRRTSLIVAVDGALCQNDVLQPTTFLCYSIIYCTMLYYTMVYYSTLIHCALDGDANPEHTIALLHMGVQSLIYISLSIYIYIYTLIYTHINIYIYIYILYYMYKVIYTIHIYIYILYIYVYIYIYIYIYMVLYQRSASAGDPGCSHPWGTFHNSNNK